VGMPGPGLFWVMKAWFVFFSFFFADIDNLR
jgi:hypothetical protein